MTRTLQVDVTHQFAGGAPIAARFEAVIARPEVTVLFGPSGAGKTTVLRAVAGLERPASGRISFGGEVWFDAAAGQAVETSRRRVGLVQQSDALFPHLTVAANLAYGLFRLSRAERERRVREVARLTGVVALLDRRPAQLSGGERQRVALGRALAPGPRMLLLDEPFAALDAPARDELRRGLRQLLATTGTPALLVTHDRDEALALGDAMVVLIGGQVRQAALVEEVFNRPSDAAVARAVGTENVLAAEVRECRDGLVSVALAGLGPPALLTAIHDDPIAGRVLACVRGEEVVLESAGGAHTSARNHLEAVVVGVEQRGPLARVALDCGFPLVALVTRRSVEDLQLAPGRRVVALVKAPSVRLIPHP
jgi:molybdate transport system ATP-binding protein